MVKSYKAKGTAYGKKRTKPKRQQGKKVVGEVANRKLRSDESYNNIDLEEIGEDFEKFDRKRK
jgi:hypothetical protein|tara:strand:- start:397 stop:585 length:189 start_codon:yes stop_codon:yes gene_type:complete